ncbi:hypothetical protein EAY27_20795, partial [Vibrio anguillarum]
EHGKEAISSYRNKLTYEVTLSEISDIRQSLFSQRFIDKDAELLRKDKIKFLTGSYARYQWVASFSFESQPIFNILFDATDIPQGNAVSALFVHNKTLSDFVLDWHK